MNSSKTFFDHYAETFDSLYDGRRTRFMQWVDHTWRSDMFVRFAWTFDLLGDLTEARVLDIGCGSGPYIVEALRRGAAHVTGLDAAPMMLRLARERVERMGRTDAVSLVEGTFPADCPTGTFDAAIVMGVMDYVADPVTFVRGVHAVAPRAVLSFPSRHWFRTPVRQVRYAIRRCPVWFYTPDLIASIMRDAGVTRFDINKVPGAGMDYIVRLVWPPPTPVR